ncbi:MAG TPA: efflux transporter outer membrane subunit, partial [Sphingomonas sp.]|nr:efflux transporter outer membrane subunit [Sphingomonas sp.]
MRPILPPFVLLALLAGCTVGPNYAGPPQAAPKAPAFVRADAAQASATAPVARWWEALGDPVLNDLVARALAANPNIAIAEARLRQARAALRIEKANELPSANAQAIYAHAHLPGVNFNSNGSNNGSSSTDLDLFNLGFDATWEVDLFGGQRRAIEAARAQAGAAEAKLADAQVSLSAEVAQAYVNLRDRQRRIDLSTRSVRMQEQMLALTQQRYDRGTASRLDVTRLQNQLDGTRADITPLNAELEAYLDELATLTGDEPGALDDRLKTAQPIPLPPAQVAVGDPAALLQRRPDIRAAERTLAADTAKIGQAEAQRFPKLSFMGIIGLGGSSPSDLTKLDDFTALVAPQLSWNFLDFGRNKARVVQAEGVRDEAEGQYRATVLAALRDAEDSLSRFRYRRITIATLARAKAEADEALALSEQRYKAGTSTLIDLLDARRQQIAAEQS